MKNPLQTAIDEALALEEIQTLLEQVEEKVKEFSTDVADRTIEKLKNFDANISERLKSDFSKDRNYSKIFDLTLLNEENIPLNKRGSGIRRLVILSFFQAQAEKRKADTSAPSIIYAIEEPETSQHPNHQKMIINALSELSEQKNVQVLFTTHSANLVKEIPIHSLRFISNDSDGNIRIEYGDNEAVIGNVIEDMGTLPNPNEAVIEKIVNTLGILPNPSDKVRVLIYVEGNHDVNALKRYSRILHDDDNNILNLDGSDKVGLKHYIEQKHLSGLGKPEVHIYDNDVSEYRTAVTRINAENNPKKAAYNTEKLELESYLHHEAIIEAYAENGTTGVTLEEITDQIDVPLEVAKKINETGNNDWNTLDPDKKKDLASRKKKLLNTKAVEKMNVNRIRAREGYNEIRSWLIKIEEVSRLN